MCIQPDFPTGFPNSPKRESSSNSADHPTYLFADLLKNWNNELGQVALASKFVKAFFYANCFDF